MTLRPTSRTTTLMGLLAAATLLLFIVDMASGSVALKLADVARAIVGADCPEQVRSIVVELRLPKAIMAMAAGSALAVSGLQMQTVFRNPLAGPYVLGISSGASLLVALLMLGGSALGFSLTSNLGWLGIAGAAWTGSAAVLLMMLAFSRKFNDIMVVLVLGILISSGVGAIVQILQYVSADDALKNFVIWTMGSLGNVTLEQLPIVLGAVAVGFILAVAAIKPLNLMALGDDYATTMGLDLKRSRTLVFASTTLLAGTITAFCGPIGFIGLALPHVGRMLASTADNRILLPATTLIGASTMLACDAVAKTFTLPINSVTAIVGIPLIIWIIIRNR